MVRTKLMISKKNYGNTIKSSIVSIFTAIKFISFNPSFFVFQVTDLMELFTLTVIS